MTLNAYVIRDRFHLQRRASRNLVKSLNLLIWFPLGKKIKRKISSVRFENAKRKQFI